MSLIHTPPPTGIIYTLAIYHTCQLRAYCPGGSHQRSKPTHWEKKRAALSGMWLLTNKWQTRALHILQATPSHPLWLPAKPQQAVSQLHAEHKQRDSPRLTITLQLHHQFLLWPQLLLWLASEREGGGAEPPKVPFSPSLASNCSPLRYLSWSLMPESSAHASCSSSISWGPSSIDPILLGSTINPSVHPPHKSTLS